MYLLFLKSPKIAFHSEKTRTQASLLLLLWPKLGWVENKTYGVKSALYPSLTKLLQQFLVSKTCRWE